MVNTYERRFCIGEFKVRGLLTKSPWLMGVFPHEIIAVAEAIIETMAVA